MADLERPLLSGEGPHGQAELNGWTPDSSTIVTAEDDIWAEENVRRIVSGQNGVLDEGEEGSSGREAEGRAAESFAPGRSSFLQSSLNAVNVLAGIGILSTPYATAQAGWLGLSFLFLFALICSYTALLLSKCIDLHPSKILSYPDIAQLAFGRFGRWLTAFFLYFELFAVAVELLILEGDNLSHLFPLPGSGYKVFGCPISAQQFFVLLTALIVLPSVWLQDLSLLSYISAGGVVSTVLVVFGVGWIGVFDGVGFQNRGSLLHVGGLPAAAGLFGFCFSGHAVVPNIYMSMRNRKQYIQVLALSFGICCILYGGMAVLGYTMYGDALQSQITLNLPKNLVASRLVIWTTVINPFTKFAITVMPIAIALEGPRAFRADNSASAFGGQNPWFGPNVRSFETLRSVFIRSGLVVAIVVVALTLPFFGLVMAFTGSFLCLSISVVVPCACYLKLMKGRLAYWEVVVNVLFMCVGVVTAACGTYISVAGIIGNLGAKV